MRKILLLPIIFILSCLTGCKWIVSSWYGIKEPEFESHESVSRFQQQVGFGDYPYIGLGIEKWKKGASLKMPDVFVFNRDGYYIPYRDSLKPNCNGPAEVFLSQLNTANAYHYSDEYTMDSFLKNMEGPQCSALLMNYSPEADFYIFITYAKYGGKKLMKSKAKVWLDALRNNKNIKYRLLMVNQDLKECWSEEQKLWFDPKPNHK